MKDLDCKWIDCDSYCHINQCMLKHAMVDVFAEHLKNAGSVNSDITAWLDTYCDRCKGCGFAKKEKHRVMNEEEYEKKQDEAESKVRNMLSKMKDEKKLKMYDDLKDKVRKHYLEKLRDISEKLEKLENF